MAAVIAQGDNYTAVLIKDLVQIQKLPQRHCDSPKYPNDSPNLVVVVFIVPKY